MDLKGQFPVKPTGQIRLKAGDPSPEMVFATPQLTGFFEAP
jgi:hypothetical protein